MFSIEFEVCAWEASRPASHALILLKHGYLRTYDCTVSDEYKSPRYLDLAAFQEALPTLESLADLVDDCCGTHIHIDCPVQADVKAHSPALFSPLERYLRDHPEETGHFWGRPSYDLVRMRHYYPTLEFRLPRFRSAEQYLEVVRFCRAAGHMLNQHFHENHPLSRSASPEQVGDEILMLYQQQVSQRTLTAGGKVHV